MKVVSVQIGQAEPQVADPTKLSGINKRPVARIRAGYTGVDGDSVVNTKHHGGPDKAVCCYSTAGLKHWSTVYPDGEWIPGTFGENLTLEGWDEGTLHVGDLLRIGGVTAQVSQPRGPCGKLAAKVGVPDFVKVCCDHGSTGWYLRILEPGEILPGDAAERIGEHPAKLMLLEANRIFYDYGVPQSDVERLLAVDALSLAWREDLAKRIQ